MNRLRSILLIVLALAVLTLSCVDPLDPWQKQQGQIPDDALVFSPGVLGITPATKTTPGDTDRGENTVTRIDVFVYKTTGGHSSYHKHYTIGTGNEAIDTGVDYLLEANWRTNYTTSDTYRIYAVANINADKLRDPVFPTAPTETQLLNLTSESLETYNGCYDIVRLKNPDNGNPAPGNHRDHHIGSKLFLMDGKVDSWMVDPSAQKQYFTDSQASQANAFDLGRAAAKFRVHLGFSDEFKAGLGTTDADSLKFTKVDEYYYEGDGVTPKGPKSATIITIGNIAKNSEGKVYADGKVEGGALVKFSNILKATYNIAPSGKTATSDPTAGQQNAFRDANLWDSPDFYDFSFRTPNGQYTSQDGEIQLYKYPYVDTTYSYAFSWDEGQSSEKAPALAVSIVYTTYTQRYNEDGSFDGEATSDGGVTNYYRIPLVDLTKTGTEAVNAIERNHYYQVWASIGSSSIEAEPTVVNLRYKVIPWPSVADEVTEAQTVQLEYFVAEKTYRLRGDGRQSTNLQYFTPKSDPVATVGTITYNQATPKITGVKVFYVDQDGREKVLQLATGLNTYKWTSNTAADVEIEVIPSANRNGGGHFHVTSSALANRSVKYIEFDTEVDFSYLPGSSTRITQHITVTHFPLDNLQSIAGKWSSYWNGSTEPVREYSWEPREGWTAETVYVSYSDYQADPFHYQLMDAETTSYTYSSVVNNWNNYGSLANSYFNPNDGYCYWRTGTYWSFSYHRIRYGGTRYYLDTSVNQPSTGNWIDWDASYNSATATFTRGNQTTSNTSVNYRHFEAKVFASVYSSTYNACCYHFAELWNGWDLRPFTNLTNNHMYVLQISKAGQDQYGNDVILGRPRLDSNHQSNDNTVSPAFMIASQLGATRNSSYSIYEAWGAASHCADYMEVGVNGRRYVGWRLPTQAEIAYIVRYQTDLAGSDVFDQVLSGYWYYTLNIGENNERRAHTNVAQANQANNTYIRCIRDLTPDEVTELNETGSITAASY